MALNYNCYWNYIKTYQNKLTINDTFLNCINGWTSTIDDAIVIFFCYYIINTSMALPSFRHLCSVSFYKRSGAVVLFRALASLFISLFRCNKVCTCSVNKRRTKSSSFCQRTHRNAQLNYTNIYYLYVKFLIS